MKKSLSPFIPLFVASVLSVGFVCPAQGANFTPDRSVTYKSVDGVELKMDVFEPEGFKATDHRPAIVFFFGGGWSGGSTKQFYQQAAAMAAQGMVAFSADYRVKGLVLAIIDSPLFRPAAQ